MKKAIIASVVAVLVIGGVSYAAFHRSSNSTVQMKSQAATSSPAPVATTTTPKASSTPMSTSQAPATPSPMNVTTSANDTGASVETINAKAGQTVNITFDVSTSGTYHGGLEFKSADPAIDSGPIAEGSSKTVTFVASKSFKFTPFWYQSDVQKDYFITVNVG
jgi:hypothetical protein